MRSLLTWLRQNYVYALILLVLLVAAALSISYAFLSRGPELPGADAPANIIDTKLDHLPLAQKVTDESESSPASGGATLAASTKCLENQTALTAVNLKIEREKNRHDDTIKQIGFGALMKEVRANEDQRHTNAMEALQQEHEALLSQTDC